MLTLLLMTLRSLQHSLRLSTRRRLEVTSRMILRNSSMVLLRLYSVHGTTQELMFTEEIMIFLIHGEQQLMFSLWHSVIWAMTAEQVLHLQETRLQEQRDFLENSSLTHRVRMLLPE